MDTNQSMPDHHVNSEQEEYFFSSSDLGLSISKAMADYVIAEARAKQNVAHDSKITVIDGTGESFTVYVSQIMNVLDPKDRIIFDNPAFDISDDRY